MNRCVFYIESDYPSVVPDDQRYDGLRYVVCGLEAPYLVNGSSYCREHVAFALGHTTIKAGKRAGN